MQIPIIYRDTIYPFNRANSTAPQLLMLAFSISKVQLVQAGSIKQSHQYSQRQWRRQKFAKSTINLCSLAEWKIYT